MENTMIMSTDDFITVQDKRSIVSIVLSGIKYLFKILINTIFCFLILITLFVLVVFVENEINKLRGKDIPLLANTYVIVSKSMSPTIKVQDAVMIFRTDPNKLKQGDIITFKSSNKEYEGYTITHRINKVIKVDGKVAFVTKGDNNNIVDNTIVPAENVYGKVVLKIPYLGFLQQVLNKPYGIILFVIIPIAIIITLVVVKLKLKNKTINENEILVEEVDDISVEVLENNSNKIIINEYGNDIELEII